VEYLQAVPNFETTIEDERSTGISISYKRDKETKKSETD
jgi:hypothetical protein